MICAVREFLDRPAWQAQAACRGIGPEAFFAPRIDRRDRWRPEPEVIALCERCTVRHDCTLSAIRSQERGWWGGLSPSARQLLADALARVDPESREREIAQREEQRQQRRRARRPAL
jgi:hypothetical protein